jgi:hypothetical protein
MTTRKRFILGSIFVLGAGVLASSRTANAVACGQLCSATSFAREDLDTQDTSTGNIGLGLSFNGTRKWSLASYQSGSDNFFTIFNDVGGNSALSIQLGGTKNQASYNGHWLPAVDNDDLLGSASRRWTAVYAVNGTIQTSDARQKREIKDLSSGLPQVLKLRPVSFKWKAGADSRVHFGLVAQEVESVLPDVVQRGDQPDDPLGLNYSELVPVLIKAVQTQQKMIESQTQRIEKLERRSGMASNENRSGLGAAGTAAVAGIPMVGLFLFSRRRRQAA